MYGKGNMETYITICKINSQWELAVWLRKLKQGLCINLEGWDGEGGGREFQKGGDIPMADSSAGSGKKQESSRKTSISALWTVWITINCGKF